MYKIEARFKFIVIMDAAGTVVSSGYEVPSGSVSFVAYEKKRELIG
jgi:hypothetical protein